MLPLPDPPLFRMEEYSGRITSQVAQETEVLFAFRKRGVGQGQSAEIFSGMKFFSGKFFREVPGFCKNFLSGILIFLFIYTHDSFTPLTPYLHNRMGRFRFTKGYPETPGYWGGSSWQRSMCSTGTLE